MTINSRQKGAAAERELAAKLRELGFPNADRAARLGKKGGEDITKDAIPGVHIECKKREALNIWDALEQAQNDLSMEEDVPVVMFKRNRSVWYLALPLDRIFEFIEAVSAAADNDKEAT